MAEKATKKKAKKRVRQNWCQMVIRARVPLKDVREGMKLCHVRGLDTKGYLVELEILSAYYDLPRQPNAAPHS